MNNNDVQIDSVALPDLSDEAERPRLGPAALRGFVRLMERWEVQAEQSRQLIWLPADALLDELEGARLSEEPLRRIGYLIGIYKALHLIAPDALADNWVSRPNDNVIFGGKKPLDYMAQGDVEALRDVRRLLGAYCAENMGS